MADLDLVFHPVTTDRWIDLESRPNQGTVFRIYLPATPGEAVSEPARTGPPPSCSSGRNSRGPAMAA